MISITKMKSGSASTLSLLLYDFIVRVSKTISSTRQLQDRLVTTMLSCYSSVCGRSSVIYHCTIYQSSHINCIWSRYLQW